MVLDLKLPVFSRINTRVFENVLKHSLKIDSIQPKKVFVIGDIGQGSSASPTLSSAYYKAARNLGLKTELHIQNHKFSSDYIDAVLAKKLRDLPKRSVIIVNVSNKMGKFDYSNLSFRKYCQKNEHKYLSSSGLKNLQQGNLKYFIDALDVDIKAQQKFGEKLANALTQANEVNIQTKKGTDLDLYIANRSAINNSGVYDEWGKGGNMPAGEVYIPPLEGLTQGRLVIDGSVRIWNKTILPTKPIILDIEKGTIKKIHKSPMSKLLSDTFSWAARRAKFHPENVRKVAELGIGTNMSAKIIGTTIVDEKKYGTAHIAFGSNGWMGGKNKAVSHFDQVFKNPIIRIDGRLFRF